eukprot:6209224-Pleurochrysis_carterae.AAC.1
MESKVDNALAFLTSVLVEGVSAWAWVVVGDCRVNIPVNLDPPAHCPGGGVCHARRGADDVVVRRSWTMIRQQRVHVPVHLPPLAEGPAWGRASA